MGARKVTLAVMLVQDVVHVRAVHDAMQVALIAGFTLLESARSSSGVRSLRACSNIGEPGRGARAEASWCANSEMG